MDGGSKHCFRIEIEHWVVANRHPTYASILFEKKCVIRLLDSETGAGGKVL